MKCISLWQPWATLMAIGAKRNETRSWETSHRGPLAIHAAKKWNRELSDVCGTEPFSSRLASVGMGAHDLPFGAIVCTVKLVDCIRITSANAPTGDERAFGNYTPGRFMWITEELQLLPLPIAYSGHQGLFNVESAMLVDLSLPLFPHP